MNNYEWKVFYQIEDGKFCPKLEIYELFGHKRLIARESESSLSLLAKRASKLGIKMKPGDLVTTVSLSIRVGESSKSDLPDMECRELDFFIKEYRASLSQS